MLQVIGGPSARRQFPAEAAPPVELHQAKNKCFEKEALLELMNKMSEGCLIKGGKAEFVPLVGIIIVSSPLFLLAPSEIAMECLYIYFMADKNSLLDLSSTPLVFR